MQIYKIFWTSLIVVLISAVGKTENSWPVVKMGIDFTSSTCEQSGGSHWCQIGSISMNSKSILLEPVNQICIVPGQPVEDSRHSNGPWPWSLANDNSSGSNPISPGQPSTPPDCLPPREWNGHWVDLHTAVGVRYIGIVTIEKRLIATNSQPNTDRTWYTLTVEILDPKGPVAKMRTSFENWDQLQSSELESNPIVNGQRTTTIQLRIGASHELIVVPNPVNPVITPLPSPSPLALDLSDKKPKAVWKVIIGSVK